LKAAGALKDVWQPGDRIAFKKEAVEQALSELQQKFGSPEKLKALAENLRDHVGKVDWKRYAVAAGHGAWEGDTGVRFRVSTADILREPKANERMLDALLEEARAQFGCAVLIDCHSMPSRGGPLESDAGRPRADIVLGDCFGEACAPAVTARAEHTLAGLGYSVRRNAPYVISDLSERRQPGGSTEDGRVRAAVRLPLAVKLSPYYTAFAHMAERLAEARADGLVLFNRFLQPDIDLETLAVKPGLKLSTSDELRLPLRWIAILHGRVPVSLAATSGAHTVEDVIKLLLVGADVVMLASVLLERGPGCLRELTTGLRAWLDEREYASVEQMKGSLSQIAHPDPAAFERAQYMRALISYSPGVRDRSTPR